MNRPRHGPRVSLAGGAAILVATVSAGAAAALLTGAGQKPGGATAVGFAAGVSLAGALGGWFVVRWPVSIPSRRVAQGLAGTAVRLFVPLFALGWLQAAAPGLRAAGAGEWLVIFYFALLAADIFLTMIGAGQIGKNAGSTPEN